MPTAYLVHKKRKCRVALENASKQVEVHEDFRCIMIEEERDLQHSDPPRLNRCEKQCLTYLDVLHFKKSQRGRLRCEDATSAADSEWHTSFDEGNETHAKVAERTRRIELVLA